jgi:plastocyanin
MLNRSAKKVVLGGVATFVAAALAGASKSETQDARLSGTVVLSRHLSSRKARFSLYPDEVRPGASSQADSVSKEMSNVVIYLESAAGSNRLGHPSSEPPLVVRQENEIFTPHVLPVVKGSTVEFRNDDPIFHNVFSLSRAASFDLGRYKRGLSKSVRFDTPGVVKLFCHIHSDMSAVILVLENGFFTSPDESGHYSLTGIPPGEYTVVAWHERARPVSRKVHLGADRPGVVDFSIPLQESAGSD